MQPLDDTEFWHQQQQEQQQFEEENAAQRVPVATDGSPTTAEKEK